MILRSGLPPSPTPLPGGGQRPAYEVFVEHQNKVERGALPIPQSSHAHLAGQLAVALLPGIFGELPDEVIEAIRQHDYGWIATDLAEVKRGEEIRPFPRLSAEEAIPAWDRTVRLAESVSPLIGVLVNRHFCLLSDDGNPLHQRFRTEAGERRRPIEASLGVAADDLDRWTAAMGVCDLLSLYLCSGCTEPVEFPFCHPADKAAIPQVGKTVLRWSGKHSRLEPPLFAPGTEVGQTVPGLRTGATGTALRWQFA